MPVHEQIRLWAASGFVGIGSGLSTLPDLALLERVGIAGIALGAALVTGSLYKKTAEARIQDLKEQIEDMKEALSKQNSRVTKIEKDNE